MNPSTGTEGHTWIGWAGISGLPLAELPAYDGAFIGLWIANKLKRALFTASGSNDG